MVRKKDSSLDILVILPWWADLILAAVAYMGLKYWLPTIEFSNPLIAGVARAGPALATVAATICVIGALVSAAVSRAARPPVGADGGRALRAVASGGQVPAIRNEPALGLPPVSRFASEKPAAVPDRWSLDLLKALEWKRFEDLCDGYFKAIAYRSETTHLGADGGIDIKLYRDQAKALFCIVQCKAWNSSSVGVKAVRELYGVMAAEGVGSGIFVTTGDYTEDAKEFAKDKKLKLLTGAKLLELIQALPKEKQDALLRETTAGDYTTPSCPSCGEKMVERTSRKSRKTFWGCRNFPRCRQTLQRRTVN